MLGGIILNNIVWMFVGALAVSIYKDWRFYKSRRDRWSSPHRRAADIIRSLRVIGEE